MSVFFSGTDTQELVDNAGNFIYYLSLIVNNKGEMCAKIAYYATINSDISYDKAGFKFSTKTPEERVLVTADCRISVLLDSLFLDRTEEIIKEAIKPVVTPATTYESYKYGHDNDYGYEINKGIYTRQPYDYKDTKGGFKKSDVHTQREIEFNKIKEKSSTELTTVQLSTGNAMLKQYEKTPAEVESFLVQMLKQDVKASGKLSNTLKGLDSSPYKLRLLLDQIDGKDLFQMCYFEITGEDFSILPIRAKALLTQCVLALKVYMEKYEDAVKEIINVFEEVIMMELTEI